MASFFAKKKNAIALDIGSSYIKVLEVSQGRNKLQATALGIQKLPPEAIVDGALMNSNEIVSAIKELLARNKIKTREVVTSVSGHSVIIKKITLPSMSREELNESIQWEAEQYIPFNIEDVNIDAQILSSTTDEAGQMDVLLVAAKKEIITDYTTILSEAGLTPVVIDVDAFAVQNMFELNYDIDPTEVIVLVNIGASIININVIKNGTTAFTRDVSLGGNQFTEEIQKHLNVSYEEAEALKVGGELMGDTQSVVPQEVENIIVAVSDTVASEIQRSLDFYSATSTEDSISKLYLSGGSSRVPGLTRMIEKFTGIGVEIVDPFRQIEVPERVMKAQHVEQIAPMAAVAVGLSLRHSGDNL